MTAVAGSRVLTRHALTGSVQQSESPCMRRARLAGLPRVACAQPGLSQYAEKQLVWALYACTLT